MSKQKQNKGDVVKQLLQVTDILPQTVKYYGLDYPKVFNRFRCSSVTDSTGFHNTTSLKYSNNPQIDKQMFNLLTRRSKLTIITCWSTNTAEIREIETGWLHKFHIHCKKEIDIPFKALDSLIYHLFCGDEYMDMKEVIKYRDRISTDETKCERVTVFMVEAKFNDSKDELDVIEFSNPPIHTSKNRFDTYQTGCLYFCENSIKHLEYQDLNAFLAPWMRKSRLMFLTVRNYIFNCFTCSNYQHIMLFSSIVLYILGFRPMNDLDMIVYKDHSQFDKPERDAVDRLSEFPFIDKSVKGTSSWKHNWNSWLMKWSNLAGASSFDDVLYDSNYHFYYFGIKIIGVNVDVIRRIERNRPNSIADLIMMNRRIPLIKIPRVPVSYNKYIPLNGLTAEDAVKYKGEGYVINSDTIDDGKPVELVCICKTDKIRFKKQVLTSLKHRYKYTDISTVKELDEIVYKIKKITIKKINVKKIKIKIKQ